MSLIWLYKVGDKLKVKAKTIKTKTDEFFFSSSFLLLLRIILLDLLELLQRLFRVKSVNYHSKETETNNKTLKISVAGYYKPLAVKTKSDKRRCVTYKL